MASKKTIDKVWNKAKSIRGRNDDVYRRDPYGNKIRRHSYGTQGEFGWEIDHKKPKSKGGSDHITNLQPVQWKENRQKGEKFKRKG